MILVLVRHAIAEEQDPQSWPNDDLRPLTEEGREKMHEVAAGLASLKYRPDRILASPLVRARQTAEILREEFAFDGNIEIVRGMAPDGSTEDLLQELPDADECVYAVGHAPNVSYILADLIGGDPDSVPFKKGAAAAVKFDGKPRSGKGSLAWFMPPAVMQKIG